MKERFQEINFAPSSMILIEKANAILDEYQRQGYQLTLRQLYYRFVAGDLLPEEWADRKTGSKNNEGSYKKLGEVISRARLAGLIDWDVLEDRTRSLRENNHWDHPADIINAAISQYRRDLRQCQAVRPEVWVEKDALVDVVGRPCRALDVPYFSCRGYVSSSTLYEAAQRFLQYLEDGAEEVRVIHLGDHDPSGIDMTRDVLERVELFLKGKAPRLTVKRIALNHDQVLQYNPPPAPAKITDTRAADYIAQFGDDCWELDALEPKTIDALVRRAVEEVTDPDPWNAAMAKQTEERAALEKVRDELKKGLV